MPISAFSSACLGLRAASFPRRVHGPQRELGGGPAALYRGHQNSGQAASPSNLPGYPTSIWLIIIYIYIYMLVSPVGFKWNLSLLDLSKSGPVGCFRFSTFFSKRQDALCSHGHWASDLRQILGAQANSGSSWGLTKLLLLFRSS